MSPLLLKSFVTLTLLLISLPVFTQLPVATHIAILKAEDSRDYDGLKPFIFSKNLKIQERAILAAARIGEGSSVDALAGILENGDPSLRALAAFALGETEMDHASPFILRALADAKVSPEIRARAIEAAGKIFAANQTGIQSKELPAAILNALSSENGKGAAANKPLVLLGLTAALRARPDGADAVIAPYLSNSDPEIVATALNTLARLRAKNVNEKSRDLLSKSADPIVRANAARLLGAAEDKESLDLLLKAATEDNDSRVRVSAIRSLGSLKDQKAVELLLQRGRVLMEAYPTSILPNPSVKNELLEIAQVLGKTLAASHDRTATMFLLEFQDWDAFQSQETEVALAQVAPEAYTKIESRLITGAIGSTTSGTFLAEWKLISGKSIGLKELAASKNKEVRDAGMHWLQDFLKGGLFDAKKTLYSSFAPAIPDALRAYAAYKPNDLNEALLENLKTKDAFVRSAAAELLAEQPVSKESTAALKTAFAKALQTDKHDNDAQLAVLSALVKLDKNEAKDALKLALDAPDYLVRRHAATLIKENDLAKEFPGFENKVGPVRKYDSKNGTKLGQVLNTDADYRRAISRKNGSVKAVFTTEKGNFTIDLFPEDAPLTVDNFVKLARSGYFNGLEVHRVVPNFVMQDGDPRGDGNGGPGWSIRCEVNMLPYNRGSVGMALSGKDTGGSQWFVTHAPQPHLDGGYTVFGRVNETDMKVVDNIVRGDKILTVRIIETIKPPRR